MASDLKRRLLQDVAELQNNPYPKITLHVQDDDVTQVCLVLEPDGYQSMHLTVYFPDDYPLRPPRVQMNSDVQHPNIYDDYICASVLNTEEDYTPAYTLKSLAIQLLSFFSSTSIEQVHGSVVKLDRFRDLQSYTHGCTYLCSKCGHGTAGYGAAPRPTPSPASIPAMYGEGSDFNWPSPQQAARTKRRAPEINGASPTANPTLIRYTTSQDGPVSDSNVASPTNLTTIENLANELLVLILDHLDIEDLMRFAQSWPQIGKVITEFDVIQQRELQCFLLKKDYTSVNLGIGVDYHGTSKKIESEFDILSYEAFHTHQIRRSIQGVTFTHWLPLAISPGHWSRVLPDVYSTLIELGAAANMGNVKPVEVIYRFMNDVVVKFNDQVEFSETATSSWHQYEQLLKAKSTLTHASEKAIQSYFHLFHLLLCLATEDPSIVEAADKALLAFADGNVSKTTCPNLGDLLVASLISTVDMTEPLLKSILKEAIVRNVVWMFKNNAPELSYMEPSAVSEYRLLTTFRATKTSYRILMFQNLFRRTAVTSPRKSLSQLRDEVFKRHGAPPPKSAKKLADAIKRIHQVDNFPDCFEEMEIIKPTEAQFTFLLRKSIRASEERGYHHMPLSQGQALYLRQTKEPYVEVAVGVVPRQMMGSSRIDFFPRKGGAGAKWRSGGRGGRGSDDRGRGSDSRGRARGGRGTWRGRGRGGT